MYSFLNTYQKAGCYSHASSSLSNNESTILLRILPTNTIYKMFLWTGSDLQNFYYTQQIKLIT